MLPEIDIDGKREWAARVWERCLYGGPIVDLELMRDAGGSLPAGGFIVAWTYGTPQAEACATGVLQHLPQYVGQDAAVAVIVHFFGCVGARDGLEHGFLAAVVARVYFDGHARR